MIVDLFAGPGGWDQGLGMLGRTDVIGVEWDRAACNTATAAGHARIQADVAALDPAMFVGVEGLIASPPCFTAGTPVVTRRGIVPIESVRVGDEALTHTGNWCTVEAVGSKMAETVTVKGQGSAGITCTPDHRFYSRSYKKWVSGTTRNSVEQWSEPEWSPANDLVGSRWAIPARADATEWEPAADPWLIGRWIADGWCNIARGEVMWAIGNDKLDEFKDRCHLPVSYSGMDGCHRATLYGAADLARWLTDNFGSGAHGKTIPGALLGAPEELRRAVFDGYLSGDSHVVDDRARKAVTVSPCLAVGVRLLAAGLGLAVSVVLNTPPATKTMSDGRVVNQSPWYAVTMRKQQSRAFLRQRDGHWWGSVRSVVPSGRARVYDIQVAGDHSYVADGIVAHNCQAWSMAGNRKGELDRENCHRLADRMAEGDDSTDWTTWEDERSPLVCQPIRWVRDLSPEWVALEEVPAVASLWEHFARIFRGMGYRAWTGDLLAADYGVPQTRLRRILMAHKGRVVHPPMPTHAEHAYGAGLFGDDVRPWVSMADALGLVESPVYVNGNQPNASRRSHDEPAPTVLFGHQSNDVRWVHERPSTTVVGTFRPDVIAAPGYRTKESRQNAEGSVRVTVEEAGILQSFPPDYPWTGLRPAPHVGKGATIKDHDAFADELKRDGLKRGVHFVVRGVSGEDDKVLQSIVMLDAVDVVDDLIRLRPGHHAMLRYERPPGENISPVDAEVSSLLPSAVCVERVTVESPLLPVLGAEPASDGLAFTVLARWLWRVPLPGVGSPALADSLVVHQAKPLGGVLPVAVFDLADPHVSDSTRPAGNSRTKQYEQVGNAIPPLLAAHILAALGVGDLPVMGDGSLVAS